MSFTRRSFITRGALAGTAGLLGLADHAAARRRDRQGELPESGTRTKTGRLFGYHPFSEPLFVPAVVMPYPLDPVPGSPEASLGSKSVFHGIAPEFYPDHPAHCDDWNAFSDAPFNVGYKLITEETLQQIIPGGPQTPVFTYRDANEAEGSGRTPGPTFIHDFLSPVVVRNFNGLTRDRNVKNTNTTYHDHETSVHEHGGHLPSHADGYPDFYVLANEARDYFYPNIAPRVTQDDKRARVCEGDYDTTWIPSTLWYHDHAMDVTGFNVAKGLAGFSLVFDEREKRLIEDNVLPDSFGTDANGSPLDVGLAIQDQRFNADGSIHYDFLDHNGRIGDVFLVNGVVQPYFKVQRRKYRFRILNASNARMYQLRLSNRDPFLVFGADSWLFPRAGVVSDFELAPGQRHDVIIDFRHAAGEVFLENIMIQEDGRKGKEVDPNKPTPLLKFVVEGDPLMNDATVGDGTLIRGFAGIDPDGQWSPIRRDEICDENSFRFERANGVFAVNNRHFNPRRADAAPELGTAEQWTFQNNSGGWWHPIHNHLEGFQIQKLDGKRPAFERSFNSDLVNLHGGELAEVFMKFRTFTGPFVFHCHTIEHEDMRMMGTHDPQPDGESPLDGETKIDAEVSGVLPDCIELEEDDKIYFDVAGDVERLEDRGTGFPECEFDNDRRGNRGRAD